MTPPKYLEHFSLNLKALSVARILLGCICLMYFFGLWQEADIFFSDKAIISYESIKNIFSEPKLFSIFDYSQSSFYTHTIIAIGFLLSLLLIAGIWVKSAIFILWLICISFYYRFPDLAYAGDNTLKLTLFWFFFLPVNHYFSVRPCVQKSADNWGHLLISFLWVIQIFLMYEVSFYQKVLNPFWFQSYDAVYYISRSTHLMKPLGVFLTSMPYWSLKLLTIATLVLEFFAPLMLFIPNARLKKSIIAAFLLFHFAIWLTIEVHIFSLLCAIWWITLIPFQTISSGTILQKNSLTQKVRLIVLGAVFSLVIIQTVNQFFNYKLVSRESLPSYATRLLQVRPNWNMFTVNPPINYNGWLVAEATTKNQKTIDLYTQQTISFEEPKDFSYNFPTIHWRTFLRKFRANNSELFNREYGNYLCQSPMKPLFIKLYFLNKKLSPDNDGIITRELLFEKDCLGKIAE